VARGDDPWPIAELIERTDAGRLRFAAGTRWSYSNIGYLFVRQLIEAACDAPLGAALQRLVLGPLGMDGARIAARPDDLAGVWIRYLVAFSAENRWPLFLKML